MWQIEYPCCPLCEGKGSPSGIVPTKPRGSLPQSIEWMTCIECFHSYTRHYWTEAGLKELFKLTMREQLFGGELDHQRVVWAEIIKRIDRHTHDDAGEWIDVGMGNGAFLFTACEMGKRARGIDLRPSVVDSIRHMGYPAEMADARTYNYYGATTVILADILEHLAYPREFLTDLHAQTSAPIFVSCPNMDSVSWRYMDSKGTNYYWGEMEHHHNFTRERLEGMLRDCGYHPVDYAVSRRYAACMEIIAV